MLKLITSSVHTFINSSNKVWGPIPKDNLILDNDRFPEMTLELWNDILDFTKETGSQLYYPSRPFDYAWTLKVIRKWKTSSEPATLLDIGGGWSPLSGLVRREFPEIYTTLIEKGTSYGNIGRPTSWASGSLCPNEELLVHNGFPDDLPKGNMYDIVVTISAIEHFKKIKQSFLVMEEVTNPGGILLITTDIKRKSEEAPIVSLIDNNRHYVNVLDARAICDIYKVSDEEREFIMAKVAEFPYNVPLFLFLAFTKESDE